MGFIQSLETPKAKVACPVQHMGKRTPNSRYESDIEEFLPFKKVTIIAGIATTDPALFIKSLCL